MALGHGLFHPENTAAQSIFCEEDALLTCVSKPEGEAAS